jgi:non-specific serine/threonine protein kinase
MRTSAGSSFGALLRQFRLDAHLSQDGLAERAAMSADGISALERGVNKAPQRETLALLVDALNLEPYQRQALEAAARRPSVPRRFKSPVARKHNLPPIASPLFGRENDLAQVRAVIAEARVLTLTGAGGVGKTRLAIELGYRELAALEGGAWFVDLAAVRDLGAVPGAIASVFGIREDPDRLLIDAIVNALRRKNLLLIFDNCEHVVSAAAAAIERIVTECPGVRALATSRQPLGIAGEQTYRLASLSLDASLALFLEAARRADPSFSIEGDLPIIERICHRLDGIALAIELAAARVRLLSIEQIEELLSQRFAVLAGGRSLARHQTMRALVDWSYDLLSPEEQSLFARLAVFPAEFSFEAALAICAGDGIVGSHVLEILGSLVDKSLVTSERRGKARRFRLLETMHAYALEKLGVAIHELSKRYAQYYLKLAESGDSRTAAWQDALEAEHDNLHRTLDWAIDENGDVPLGIRLLAAMREFVLYRGLGPDSARRAERALDGRTSLAKPLQAMAWETIAAMRGDLLMPAAALDATTRALTLYKELEDLGGVGRALRRRGVAYLRLGNLGQAEKDLQRAFELSKEYGDARAVARSLASIAVIYGMTGRLKEAQKTMLEALEVAQQEGDERLIGMTLINLAETDFALGEPESSVGHLEELLASKVSRKNVRLRANAKANLAVYLLALHRNEEARAMARGAMLDAREAGDAGIGACAIQHLALIMSRADPRAAAKLLGHVDAVFAAGYRRENTERHTHALLLTALSEKLNDDEITSLGREGAAMSEPQAARLATHGPRAV